MNDEEGIMTPTDLLTLVEKAGRGDFIEYYRGSLNINQTLKMLFLTNAAGLLHEEKVVMLTQKRLKAYSYIYYAVRTSKPFEVSKRTLGKIERMTQ